MSATRLQNPREVNNLSARVLQNPREVGDLWNLPHFSNDAHKDFNKTPTRVINNGFRDLTLLLKVIYLPEDYTTRGRLGYITRGRYRLGPGHSPGRSPFLDMFRTCVYNRMYKVI